MVEKVLWNNVMNAKWLIGSLVVGSVLIQKVFVSSYITDMEVFGHDGNGGSMLKIITNLTDEEMARLKYARRINWHWKGSRKMDHGKDVIQIQELSDRGINWPQEPYIEYEKRPPHDKYL
jgi:hypothetical protein